MQDRKGKELQVGDLINVPCIIEHLAHEGGSDHWINARIRTVEPMHPGQYRPEIAVNTKQVEFVSRTQENIPALVEGRNTSRAGEEKIPTHAPIGKETPLP